MLLSMDFLVKSSYLRISTICDYRTLRMKESYQRLASAGSAATFTYDSVFGTDTDNDAVYKAFAKERVLSAMQVKMV